MRSEGVHGGGDVDGESAVTSLTFVVEGIPQPQGSKTGFVARSKKTGKTRAVITDKNPALLKPWRAAVAAAAKAARGPDLESFGSDAVAVDIWFGMPRGVTVTREYPSVRPDVDKLIRAVFDAITTSGLYEDDGQVVDLHVHERYSVRPGVVVKVSRMPGLIGGSQ